MAVEQKHYAHYECEKDRETEITHACNKSRAHRQKQRADFFCRSGNASETYKAECARNRNACADVSVYKHYNHADNSGQKC